MFCWIRSISINCHLGSENEQVKVPKTNFFDQTHILDLENHQSDLDGFRICYSLEPYRNFIKPPLSPLERRKISQKYHMNLRSQNRRNRVLKAHPQLKEIGGLDVARVLRTKPRAHPKLLKIVQIALYSTRV